MARPNKIGLYKFPIWNPTYYMQKRFHDYEFKIRYKAIRSSSSTFIKRKDVRDVIFERDGYKCSECGNTNKLTIDHINSVYSASIGKTLIHVLNVKSNLTTLCLKCNSTKKP